MKRGGGFNLNRLRTDLDAMQRTRAGFKGATVKSRGNGNHRQQEWSRKVKDKRGRWCRAAELGGCLGVLEADHIWERSQGGPFVVENGGVLCHAHHEMKTDNKLRWRFEWLSPDQVAWFAVVGFVAWDPTTGEPYGPGMRTFDPLRPEQLARLVAEDRIPLLQR